MSSAAFEIVKGERRIPFVSEREVERCLDLRQLLDGLQAGFGRLDAGVVQVPPRPEITVPDRGYSLAMMAWEPGMQICVKVVNVFEGNLNLALPNHLAMITLFDPDTGAVSCLMDGTYITGIRTAASAAVGVRLLSRADAKVATIVGAGVQAREHLRLLPLVRDLERINICSLDVKHSARLAERSNLAEPRPDLQASIEESDIVCLATHSPVPVIDPDWVLPARTCPRSATARRTANFHVRWRSNTDCSWRRWTPSNRHRSGAPTCPMLIPTPRRRSVPLSWTRPEDAVTRTR
jgi:ornithine cyclodeaminase/alanine dehydrogenase-like protein (mu-crystallin family)